MRFVFEDEENRVLVGTGITLHALRSCSFAARRIASIRHETAMSTEWRFKRGAWRYTQFGSDIVRRVERREEFFRTFRSRTALGLFASSALSG